MRERRKNTFAPDQHGDSADHADADADLRTDPVVLECVLEKVRRAHEHGGDADAVQPMRADEALEIAPGLRCWWLCFCVKLSRHTFQRRESRLDRREPPLDLIHADSVGGGRPRPPPRG